MTVVKPAAFTPNAIAECYVSAKRGDAIIYWPSDLSIDCQDGATLPDEMIQRARAVRAYVRGLPGFLHIKRIDGVASHLIVKK